MVLSLVPVWGEIMDSVNDVVSYPYWRKES